MVSINTNNFTLNDLKIDDQLKCFLKECIFTNSLINILFYGNPGTGKTTSVDVFINEYKNHTLNEIRTHTHENDENIKNELNMSILRLNASVYRNTSEFLKTVMKFINSKPMYITRNIKKFILLDEIDYMTHQGQQCLSNILSVNSDLICLSMCNYKNRLCDSLLSHFFIINYNSFISIIKTLNENTHLDIYKETIAMTTTIYDIRDYYKEIARLSLIEKTDFEKLYRELIYIKKKIKESVFWCETSDIINVYKKCIQCIDVSHISSVLGISKEKIIYFLILKIIKEGRIKNEIEVK